MPMTAMTVASVAAPIVGGLIGADQASKDRDAAAKARAEALAQYAGISVPELQSQLLQLQQYGTVGDLDPALQELINLGPSAMEGVSTDPRLKADQMQALEAVSNLAQGNVQPGDMAGFELARQNAAGELNAQNNSVLQNMAQRGQAGSGAELLAKLKNNQSGADMLQKSQLEQAQAMQQARINALAQQANMATGIRSQDYSEQSNLAKAKDAIAQFNAQNAQNVAGQNTNTKNNAQQFNLTNKQNVANMNTETANKQQISNKGLIQQKFNNDMQLAGAKAGQLNTNAGASDKSAAQTAGMWAGVGQGVGTGLNSLSKLFGNNAASTAAKPGTSAGEPDAFDPSSYA